MARKKKPVQQVAPEPAEAPAAPSLPSFPPGKVIYFVFGPSPPRSGRLITDPENSLRPGAVPDGWEHLYSVVADTWTGCMQAFNEVEERPG